MNCQVGVDPSRAQRVSELLSAARSAGYDVTAYTDPCTGARDLIADILHSIHAQSANVVHELDAGFSHWLEEAVEATTPPPVALQAASLETWESVFADCVEEGQCWRPQFRLNPMGEGRYEVYDERESVRKRTVAASVEQAIAIVQQNYDFDSQRILAVVDDTRVALAILVVIARVARETSPFVVSPIGATHG